MPDSLIAFGSRPQSKRITVPEIAAEMSISIPTVDEMLKAGKISNLRPGNIYIVCRSPFEAWFATLGLGPEKAQAKGNG